MRLASTPMDVHNRAHTHSHTLEIGLGTAGIIAALLGLAIAPHRAGNVTLLVWDFNRENIAAGWGYGLFIAAGLLLAVAFGLYATKATRRNHHWTTGARVAGVLSVVAGAGALVCALIWLL